MKTIEWFKKEFIANASDETIATIMFLYEKYGNPNEISSAELDFIISLTKELPTIDVVPVVRCKDCKHYNTVACSKGFGWCENIDRGTSDNFYCANGKQYGKED